MDLWHLTTHAGLVPEKLQIHDSKRMSNQLSIFWVSRAVQVKERYLCGSSSGVCDHVLHKLDLLELTNKPQKRLKAWSRRGGDLCVWCSETTAGVWPGQGCDQHSCVTNTRVWPARGCDQHKGVASGVGLPLFRVFRWHPSLLSVFLLELSTRVDVWAGLSRRLSPIGYKP